MFERVSTFDTLKTNSCRLVLKLIRAQNAPRARVCVGKQYCYNKIAKQYDLFVLPA